MHNAVRTDIDIHRLCTDFGGLSFDEAHPLPIEHSAGMRKTLTGDVYEQACTITAWQQLYDQLYPGMFQGGLSELWLDRVQFFKESTNRALRQSCVVWPGAVWFGLPRLKSQDSRVCASPLTDDAIAVRQGGHEFELLTPDDLDIMGLVMPQSELAQFIGVEPHDLDGKLQQNAVWCVGAEKKASYWQFMDDTLRVIELHPERLQSPAVCKLMKEALLSGIVDLLNGASPSEPLRYSQRNYYRIVSGARDFLLERPDEPATITELCEHLAVSRRTLQNAFQSVLDICPVSYLKAIRLNAVRRELASDYSPYATVQDAAVAWGFWHLSQFAADYQRLFNERPSQTLARRGSLLAQLVSNS